MSVRAAGVLPVTRCFGAKSVKAARVFPVIRCRGGIRPFILPVVRKTSRMDLPESVLQIVREFASDRHPPTPSALAMKAWVAHHPTRWDCYLTSRRSGTWPRHPDLDWVFKAEGVPDHYVDWFFRREVASTPQEVDVAKGVATTLAGWIKDNLEPCDLDDTSPSAAVDAKLLTDGLHNPTALSFFGLQYVFEHAGRRVCMLQGLNEVWWPVRLVDSILVTC